MQRNSYIVAGDASNLIKYSNENGTNAKINRDNLIVAAFIANEKNECQNQEGKLNFRACDTFLLGIVN